MLMNLKYVTLQERQEKTPHKITAIYWVLADLPARYRSTLSSIYLAVLSNSNDVKKFGFEPVVEPLLKELCTLENQGFYIDTVG